METKKVCLSDAVMPLGPEALWRGCILSSIVYAVMLTEYPFILNEHVWAGNIYMTLNHEGAKAVIVFSEDRMPLAGLFRDFESSRIELALTDKYAASHFSHAPEDRKELALGAFPCFEKEPSGPVAVTSGFWAEEDGRLYSEDGPQEWYDNGGFILDRQLKPFEEAVAEYADDFEIDERRLEIIERVYREKTENPEGPVYLTDEESEYIKRIEPVNAAAAKEAFAAIGVLFS